MPYVNIKITNEGVTSDQKAELIDSTKNELESFFKDVTKEIEIINSFGN